MYARREAQGGAPRIPGVAAVLLDSPVGTLLAAASSHGVCLLEFAADGDPHRRLARVRERFGYASGPRPAALLRQLERELAEYFAGARRAFDVPLSYAGSAFRERVWRALLEIPYGATCSYLEIALRLGDRQSLRAVGQANGANPIAIVIPCHRVVNGDGTLGGYGGGRWRKQFLLDLERGDRLL